MILDLWAFLNFQPFVTNYVMSDLVHKPGKMNDSELAPGWFNHSLFSNLVYSIQDTPNPQYYW